MFGQIKAMFSNSKSTSEEVLLKQVKDLEAEVNEKEIALSPLEEAVKAEARSRATIEEGTKHALFLSKKAKALEEKEAQLKSAIELEKLKKAAALNLLKSSLDSKEVVKPPVNINIDWEVVEIPIEEVKTPKLTPPTNISIDWTEEPTPPVQIHIEGDEIPTPPIQISIDWEEEVISSIPVQIKIEQDDPTFLLVGEVEEQISSVISSLEKEEEEAKGWTPWYQQ